MSKELEVDRFGIPIKKSTVEVDRFGIPIKKSTVEVDRFGIPIKKKGQSEQGSTTPTEPLSKSGEDDRPLTERIKEPKKPQKTLVELPSDYDEEKTIDIMKDLWTRQQETPQYISQPGDVPSVEDGISISVTDQLTVPVENPEFKELYNKGALTLLNARKGFKKKYIEDNPEIVDKLNSDDEEVVNDAHMEIYKEFSKKPQIISGTAAEEIALREGDFTDAPLSNIENWYYSLKDGMNERDFNVTMARELSQASDEEARQILEKEYERSISESEDISMPEAGLVSGEGLSKMLGSQVVPIARATALSLIPGVGTAASVLYSGADASATSYGAAFRSSYIQARSQGMSESDAYKLAKDQSKVEAATGFVEGSLGAFTGKAATRFGGKMSQKFSSKLIRPLISSAAEGTADMGLDAGAAAVGQIVNNVSAKSRGLETGIFDGVTEEMLGEIIFSAGMKVPSTIKTVAQYKKYANALPENEQQALINKIIDAKPDIDSKILTERIGVYLDQRKNEANKSGDTELEKSITENPKSFLEKEKSRLETVSSSLSNEAAKKEIDENIQALDMMIKNLPEYSIKVEGEESALTKDDFIKKLDDPEFIESVAQGEIDVKIDNDVLLSKTLQNKVDALTKTEEDAVQKQEPDEVPVQPEVEAGRKVEEEVPETRPEEPAEEGKEEVRETTPDEFAKKLKDTKEADPEFYWSVDEVAKEDLEKGTIISSEGGNAVVAPDGDIKGVFKEFGSKVKGFANKILKKAVDAGGTKLDNFDGALTNIYKKNGFRVVSRTPFNEEFAPEGWNEKVHGKPDIVAMVYDPDNKLDIEEKTFSDPETGYDDAIKYRDSFITKAEKKPTKKQKVKPTTIKKQNVSDVDAIVERATSEEQKSALGFISNVVKALTGIDKDVEVIVHEDADSYAAEVERQGGDPTEVSSGFFDNGSQIHINASEVQNTTAFHEGGHKVIASYLKRSPEALSKFEAQLKSKLPKEVIESLNDFVSEYDPDERSEEFVVEALARIAAGDINLDKSALDKIKDYLRGIAKSLGMNPDMVKLTGKEDVQDFARKLSEAFTEGKEINILENLKNEGSIEPTVVTSLSTNIPEEIKGSKRKPKLRKNIKESDIIDINTLKGKPVEFMFYDNFTSDNYTYQNDKLGYSLEKKGEGGAGYSYREPMLEIGAVGAVTNIQTGMRVLNHIKTREGISKEKPITGVALQSKDYGHLGNLNILNDLYGNDGHLMNMIKSGVPEKEIVRELKKAVDYYNRLSWGKSLIQNKIDIKSSDINSVSDLFNILNAQGFGNRNIFNKRILQEKPTKVTKATPSHQSLLHNEYGMPTLQEISSTVNEDFTSEANSGDVVKFIDIDYTRLGVTDPSMLTKNEIIKAKEKGVKLELIPSEYAHTSYPVVFFGKNVGIPSNFISLGDINPDFEKYAFYKAGRRGAKSPEIKMPEITPKKPLKKPKFQKKAPNGKPSNLNEEQYEAVRTPEFKNWFGDWENDPKNASKVVDENGEPLVVYHGSPTVDIEEFDRSSSEREQAGINEMGTYFATNKNLSNIYSKAPLTEEAKLNRGVKIKALEEKQNKVRNNRDFDALTEEIDALKKGERVYPVFLNIRDMHTFDGNAEVNIEAWNNLELNLGYKWAKGRAAMEALAGKNRMVKNMKVDGIKAENIIDMSIGALYSPEVYKKTKEYKEARDKYLGDVYLLFDDQPENIKLADGTNRTFDPKSPNIKLQKKGKPKPDPKKDRVDDVIKGIINKVTKRVSAKADPKKVKERQLNDALNYLQRSKWYEDATDTQREAAVVSLKKSLGEKIKGKTKVQKDIEREVGVTKEPTWIKMTQKSYFEERVRTINKEYKRGSKAAKEEVKELGGKLLDYINEAFEGLDISKATQSQLRYMIKNVKASNIESLMERVDKKVSKALEKQRLETINKIAKTVTNKRTVLKKRGNKWVGKIDPETMDLINNFNLKSLEGMTNKEVLEVSDYLDKILEEGRKKIKIIENLKKKNRRVNQANSLNAFYKGETETLENPTVDELIDILKNKDKAVIVDGQLISSVSALRESLNTIAREVGKKKITPEALSELRLKLSNDLSVELDKMDISDSERSSIMDSIMNINKDNVNSVVGKINSLIDNPKNIFPEGITDFSNVKVFNIKSKQMAEFNDRRKKSRFVQWLNPFQAKANIRSQLSRFDKLGKEARLLADKINEEVAQSEQNLSREANLKQKEYKENLEKILGKRWYRRLNSSSNVNFNTEQNTSIGAYPNNGQIVNWYNMYKTADGKEKIDADPKFNMDAVNEYMNKPENKDLKDYADYLINDFYVKLRDEYESTYFHLTQTNFPKGVYYPLFSTYADPEITDPVSIMDGKGNVNYRSAVAGNLKQRVNHNNELDYNKDSHSVAMNYIATMERSKHMIPLGELINSTFNKNSMPEIINAIGNQNTTDLVDHLSTVVTGRSPRESKPNSWSKGIDILQSAIVIGSLAFKPASIPKQSTSAFRFIRGEETSFSGWIRGFIPTNKNELELMNRIRTEEYVPQRFGGAAVDPSVARLVESEGLGRRRVLSQQATKAAMFTTAVGDISGVLIGGSPYALSVYRNKIDEGMSHEDASNYAYDMFVKTSEETQQSKAGSEISHMQRDKAGRIFTQFSTSQTQGMNKIVNASRKLMYAKESDMSKDEKMKHAYDIMFYLGENMIFGSVATGFIRELVTGDLFEDERKAIKGTYDLLMDNLQSLLMGVGSTGVLANWMINKGRGDEWKNNLPIVQEIGRVADGAMAMSVWLAGGASTKSWDKMSKQEKSAFKKMTHVDGFIKTAEDIIYWFEGKDKDKTFIDVFAGWKTKEQKKDNRPKKDMIYEFIFGEPYSKGKSGKSTVRPTRVSAGRPTRQD